jgi:hypothetical protein
MLTAAVWIDDSTEECVARVYVEGPTTDAVTDDVACLLPVELRDSGMRRLGRALEAALPRISPELDLSKVTLIFLGRAKSDSVTRILRESTLRPIVPVPEDF